VLRELGRGFLRVNFRALSIKRGMIERHGLDLTLVQDAHNEKNSNATVLMLMLMSNP